MRSLITRAVELGLDTRIPVELLGGAGRDNAIDAMVVAEAIQVGRAIVLTSEVDDLRDLTGTQNDVAIHPL